MFNFQEMLLQRWKFDKVIILIWLPLKDFCGKATRKLKRKRALLQEGNRKKQ